MTLNMVYWRGGKFRLDKLPNHPEIMSQGETLEELEENLRNARHEILPGWCEGRG